MTTYWRRLQHWAARLRRDVLTLWFAGRDPGTPTAAKLVAIAIAAYAFSPIDLIPDFIPVLGMLDEVILLPLAIAFCLRLIPPAIVLQCRERADEWFADRRDRPRSVVAAVVIASIWIAVAACAGYIWRHA